MCGPNVRNGIFGDFDGKGEAQLPNVQWSNPMVLDGSKKPVDVPGDKKGLLQISESSEEEAGERAKTLTK